MAIVEKYAVIINGIVVADNLSIEQAVLAIKDVKTAIDNYKIVKVVYDDSKK